MVDTVVLEKYDKIVSTTIIVTIFDTKSFYEQKYNLTYVLDE